MLSRLHHEEDPSLAELKRKVGIIIKRFTYVFFLISTLVPFGIYCFELAFTSKPPTFWWLNPIGDNKYKSYLYSVKNNDKNSSNIRLKPYQFKKYYNLKAGVFCYQNLLLTHNQSQTYQFSHSQYIFDAMYNPSHNYVSIMLNDYRFNCTDSQSITSSSFGSHSKKHTHVTDYNKSSYWIHPKSFICRYYDRRHRLLAAISSLKSFESSYVRCPIPKEVNHHHHHQNRILLRLQWHSIEPNLLLLLDQSYKYDENRNTNQSYIKHTKREHFKSHSQMTPMFAVCTVSSPQHNGVVINSSYTEDSDNLTHSKQLKENLINSSIGIEFRTKLNLRKIHDSAKYNISICTNVGIPLDFVTSFSLTPQQKQRKYDRDRYQLIEWLEYHKLIGIDHIFIYDYYLNADDALDQSEIAVKDNPFLDLSPRSQFSYNSIFYFGDSGGNNDAFRNRIQTYISDGYVTIVPWFYSTCDTNPAECEQNSYDDIERLLVNQTKFNTNSSNYTKIRKYYEYLIYQQTIKWHEGQIQRTKTKNTLLNDMSLQSCYLRHSGLTKWMAIVDAGEFIGLNLHKLRHDGKCLENIMDLIYDTEKSHLGTIALQFQSKPYFSCTDPLKTKNMGSRTVNNSSYSLLKQPNLQTISSKRSKNKIAIMRSDNVVYFSRREPDSIYAYLFHYAQDKNKFLVVEKTTKKKLKYKDGAAELSSILTYLRPTTEEYSSSVITIDPDIAHILQFRKSYKISPCDELVERVGIYDIMQSTAKLKFQENIPSDDIFHTDAKNSQNQSLSNFTIDKISEDITNDIWYDNICRQSDIQSLAWFIDLQKFNKLFDKLTSH